MLQLDDMLINALHDEGFEVAIETNGTLAVPKSIDWICVSPKADATLVQTTGNELKLVYPQSKIKPEDCTHLAFDHFYLQAMDGEHTKENLKKAMSYCLQNPQWKLSL